MDKLRQSIALLIQRSKDRGSKSPARIAFDLINYGFRQGLSPGEYFAYELHLKEATPSYCMTYLPNTVHFQSHLKALNATGREILFDKLLFKDAMQKANIPVPGTLGYAGPATRESLNFERIQPATIEQVLSEANVSRFIIKPATGTQGAGVFVVEYEPAAEKCLTVANRRLDAEEFFRFILERCADLSRHYVIFEQLITTTDSLKKVSPDAAPNIRVITLKLPNGEVHTTSASIRLGRSNSVTSNAGSGGMPAALDIDSGAIVNCRTTMNAGGKPAPVHPDTLAPIDGVVIPGWAEVKALCVQAATSIHGVNSVGWDVLIGDEGPVLLEANDDWGIISEQVVGGGYLTEENRRLLKHYHLEFPESRLPRPSLVKFKQSLFGLER